MVSNTPGRPFISWYNLIRELLNNCHCFREGSHAKKQNPRRNDEEDNSGSGKLTISYEISGYGRFFHGKSGSNTPPGGPHQSSWKIVNLKLLKILHVKVTRIIACQKLVSKVAQFVSSNQTMSALLMKLIRLINQSWIIFSYHGTKLAKQDSLLNTLNRGGRQSVPSRLSHF